MPSELQSSLSRAFGERLDASVVEVTATVEHDCLDAGLLRGGGDLLADFLRLLGLVALEPLEAGPLGGSERAARRVVDDRGEDAAVRAEHDQAGALGGAGDLAANTAMTAKPPGADSGRAHADAPQHDSSRSATQTDTRAKPARP